MHFAAVMKLKRFAVMKRGAGCKVSCSFCHTSQCSPYTITLCFLLFSPVPGSHVARGCKSLLPEGIKLSWILGRGSLFQKLKQNVLRPALRCLKQIIALLASKNISMSIRTYKATQMKTYIIPDNPGLVYFKNQWCFYIWWYKNQVRSSRYSGDEQWIFLILLCESVVGRAEYSPVP